MSSQSHGHGNTPAAWTLTILALIGCTVSGVAIIMASPMLFWVGVAVVVGLSARLIWAWVVTSRDIRARRARHAQAVDQRLFEHALPGLEMTLDDQPPQAQYGSFSLGEFLIVLIVFHGSNSPL